MVSVFIVTRHGRIEISVKKQLDYHYFSTQCTLFGSGRKLVFFFFMHQTEVVLVFHHIVIKKKKQKKIDQFVTI